jgi:hypothetical protein
VNSGLDTAGIRDKIRASEEYFSASANETFELFNDLPVI